MNVIADDGPPVITSLDGPATITTDGGPYVFTVTITGGTPPYYISWMVNGKEVKPINTKSITVSAAQLTNNGNTDKVPEVTVYVGDSENRPAGWLSGSSTSPNTQFMVLYHAQYDEKHNFAGAWSIAKFPSEWPYRMPATPTPTITPTPPPLDDSGARFSSLSGQVEVRHDYDPKHWDFAKMETVLYTDDHVKTAEDSTAIIGFADLSTFLLKPESEIVITTPPKKDSKIGLIVGNIMVNVRKMMKDGTMEIDLSQAVAGAKGTVFIAESNATSSTVKGIIHNVTLTNKATGNTITVGPGEEVTATAAGFSPVSTFNVTREETAWGVTEAQLLADPSPTTSTGGNPTGKSGMSMLPLIGAGIAICLYAIVRRKK